MRCKKLIIVVLLLIVFILTGCLKTKSDLKIKDYTYDKETFELTVLVEIDEKTKERNLTTFGILYEFTKVDKVSDLTTTTPDINKLEKEITEEEIENGVIEFKVSDVGHYIKIYNVSVRPYAVEIKDGETEYLLSGNYRVLPVEPNENVEPYVENPIITAVHVKCDFSNDYIVTCEENTCVARYNTTDNYDKLYIYVTANDGYHFPDDVEVIITEINGKNLGKLTISNTQKQIEIVMRDPMWTPIY